MYLFYAGYLLNTNKDVSLCRQILQDDNEVYDYPCTKQNSFLLFKQWLQKSQHPKFIECPLNLYSKDNLYEMCISKIDDALSVALSILVPTLNKLIKLHVPVDRSKLPNN